MILASLSHFGAGGAAPKPMPTAFKGQFTSITPSKTSILNYFL